MFLLLKEKKKQINDSWNVWFWLFGSKNGPFVMHIFFSKKCFAETLKVVKKGNFGHPPKNLWLINEKLIFGFGGFCFSFLFSFFLVLFSFLSFVFFVFEGLRVR